jgi:hypothetical protein
MFETVRKNQKILQIILLILIVPSFVFLGVDSYTKSGDSKTDIAKVHQESITQVELENAIKAQGQKLGITGQSLDNPNFKNAILGQLIQQKLLNFDLKSLNLQIPDATLAKEILKFPEVALLKKPSGAARPWPGAPGAPRRRTRAAGGRCTRPRCRGRATGPPS